MTIRRCRAIAFACLAIFPLTACKHPVRNPPEAQNTEAEIRFDPQPKPVVQELGIVDSASPRLGARVSGEIDLSAIYGKDKRLGFFMSHNEGDTFMGPIAISSPGARVAAHGEVSPTFAQGPTANYALWQEKGSRGTVLLVARSLSWGHTFEKPVGVVHKSKPSFNGFSSIGVAPSGDVYVAWLDGRDKPPPVPDSLDPEGTFGIYLARSTDQGASFGPNVRIAFGACPCCRPALAFGAHGEVFVAWRKVFPGDYRGIVVAASRDAGRTFSEPMRVASDHWKISGCPDSGPTLAVHGGRVYVAWMSEGDHRPGIRLASSDDGAQTFAKPVIVSGTVLYPNHPSLAIADDGAVFVAFQGRDPEQKEGWADVAAYLVEAGGSRATKPLKVPGNQGSASYPQVLAGGTGRIYVAWTETTDQGSRVVLSRGRRN